MEGGGEKTTNLEPLHHIIRIHLNPAHIKLHGANMLEHPRLGHLVAPTHQVFILRPSPVSAPMPDPVARVLARGLLGALLLERVQHLELLPEEGLRVDGLDLEHGGVRVAPGQLERVHAGVLDRVLVQGDGGALRVGGVVGVCCGVAAVGVAVAVLSGEGAREGLVEVY